MKRGIDWKSFVRSGKKIMFKLFETSPFGGEDGKILISKFEDKKEGLKVLESIQKNNPENYYILKKEED